MEGKGEVTGDGVVCVMTNKILPSNKKKRGGGGGGEEEEEQYNEQQYSLLISPLFPH